MGTSQTRIAGAMLTSMVLLVVLIAVRSRIPAETLAPHYDAASAVFAGVGVIFGVMLGQLVVAGWNDYQSARMASFREAAALRNIVRLADGFSPSQRMTILKLTDDFARAVVDDEWPNVQNRDVSGQKSANAMHDLFHFFAEIDMSADRGSPYLDASIHKLGEFSDARAERLAAIRLRLPEFMWGVLIVEAMLVVGFVPFLGGAGNQVHSALTLVLALAVFLLLFLVWVLDNPFQPPSGIAADDFNDVVQLVRLELERETESNAEEGSA